MKTYFFGDIHGNISALEAVIRHFSQLSLPKTVLLKLLIENTVDFFKIHLDPAALLG